MTARARTCRFAPILSAALAAAVCGCGARTGTVEGRATVDGKPAVGATVILTGGEDQSAMAIVRTDGTYQTPGVPVGPVTIALMPDMGVRLKPDSEGGGAGSGSTKMEGMPKAAQRPAPSPAIPKRYTNAATSGLTLTVTGGHNEFNIEMTSP